jgi:c-di-GMP-binding flagellar brake protein YcgR
MEERRKYIRLIESLKIIYTIVDPPPPLKKGCLSEDIGGGGLRFSIEHRLSKQDTLDLEIWLPRQTQSIRAIGKVVWVSQTSDVRFKYAVGIQFIEIDPFERGKILNYVRKRVVHPSSDDISWIDG